MAAWHEPRKPGVERGLWVGLAWALYLAAMLGLVGVILWRVWTEVLAGLGPL